jgi:hypothetical protein
VNADYAEILVWADDRTRQLRNDVRPQAGNTNDTAGNIRKGFLLSRLHALLAE